MDFRSDIHVKIGTHYVHKLECRSFKVIGDSYGVESEIRTEGIGTGEKRNTEHHWGFWMVRAWCLSGGVK